MIIQIKDGKYQSYEVDVSFITKELVDYDLEEMPDGRNKKIPITTLKIIGWNYDTSNLTQKQQAEVEHHLKEYLMDIEDLLN